MKNALSRRNIIKSSMAVSAALLVNPLSAGDIIEKSKENISFNSKYGSIAKHGNLVNDDFMLWSLLSGEGVAKLNDKISELRGSKRYKSILSYSSTDRYKLDICKAIIDLIAQEEAVTFDMVYFKGYSDRTKVSPMKLEQLKANIYRHFRGLGLSEIYIKSEDGFGPSREFISSTSEVSGMTPVIQRVYSDNLLQLNDFISGTVYAIIKEGHKVKSKVKLELIDHFKKSFEIRDDFREGDIGKIITIKRQNI